MRSFGVKLVLLATVASGLVLLTFAAFSLSTIRRVGLERIDRELQALADAQIRGPHPPGHWARFDDSLSSLYGQEREGQCVMMALDNSARPLFVSSRWPTGLAPADLGVTATPGLAPMPERNLAPPGREPPPRSNDDGRDLRPPPDDRNPRLAQPEPWLRGPPPVQNVKTARFLTLTTTTHTWRFMVTGNDEITLLVGLDLADFRTEIGRFRTALAMVAPLALALLAAAGWLLAGQALHPVRVLARTADTITARGLDQRVPTGNADHEFRTLIDVINRMLDRLERSFQQAVRFGADAAHELKTPLTILQGQLEQALQNAPAASAEQRTYADLIEEVQRLKVIVRKLLLLAQADSGQLRLSQETVDLTAEVEAVVDDARSQAAGLTITADLTPAVAVQADPDLLRQALQNLASNALKHNRPGGSLAFTLDRDGDRACVTVTNTTDPAVRIDPSHLFERFYRGDRSRGRRVDGAGLGLSLAREIARAHQGDVELTELNGDHIAFALRLPLGETAHADGKSRGRADAAGGIRSERRAG